MKALAHVVTMFKPDYQNPNDRSILNGLKTMGHEGVISVRTGKEFQIEIEVKNRQQAHQIVDEMCKQLLAHRVTDDYSFTITFPDGEEIQVIWNYLGQEGLLFLDYEAQDAWVGLFSLIEPLSCSE